MKKVDLKIVLLGHESVGKTCLVRRYIYETFTDKVQCRGTIGAAYSSKEIDYNGNSVVLGIWDTAGSERYEAMTKMYYREANAAIVCFDLATAITFQRAKYWIRELRMIEENCKIYLCGTKLDLLKSNEVQAMDMTPIENYAACIQAKFYITSSKTGENIAELFDEIVQDFIATNPVLHERKNDIIDLNTQLSNKRYSRCCLS
ncbi:ras-related protein Rab-24 [Lasioglossum baleicum]|uniref:ras-related protein Rab-24 n=1 Tax=Lasioglossum baleicum TaxID=434251 RepID=UPI003FCC8B6E